MPPKNSFYDIAIMEWHTLDRSLKKSSNLVLFKSKVKLFLSDRSTKKKRIAILSTCNHTI